MQPLRHRHLAEDRRWPPTVQTEKLIPFGLWSLTATFVLGMLIVTMAEMPRAQAQTQPEQTPLPGITMRPSKISGTKSSTTGRHQTIHSPHVHAIARAAVPQGARTASMGRQPLHGPLPGLSPVLAIENARLGQPGKWATHHSHRSPDAARTKGKPLWLSSPAARAKIRDWRWKYRWWIRGGTLTLNWGIVVLVGRGSWQWGKSRKFLFHNDRWFEKDPRLDGGSDKFGHLYGMYLMQRGFTYIFDETGAPHWLSTLASGINSALIGIAIECGDAYTAYYGFSYSDLVFDLIGTGLGVLQDAIPALDGLFSLSMWYWPSSGYLSDKNEHRENLFTDYDGTKYFFHLLMSGIPGVRRTPFKYLRLDVAYWARGFKPYSKDFPYHMRQYVYVGVSLDFAQMVWDLFPHKWYRKSTYVFLKYFNLYGPIESGYKFPI